MCFNLGVDFTSEQREILHQCSILTFVDKFNLIFQKYLLNCTDIVFYYNIANANELADTW